MDADVFSNYLTSTGTIYTGRTRVRAYSLTGTGTVVFRDGGASGTTRLTVANTGTTNGFIPANGIVFNTDVHATISGVTGLTVFYG